jgi:hypothetical protein
MRNLTFIASVAIFTSAAGSEPSATNLLPSPDPFEQLKVLAGEWQADLPKFGTLTNTVRLVSNGKAIEETIGTPTDNEISIYTRDNSRILLTHYCAMTPDGHQVRLEATATGGAPGSLTFVFRDATNLHSLAAPHMRRVSIQIADPDHFTETWTKTENGKDTVFDLNFARR